MNTRYLLAGVALAAGLTAASGAMADKYVVGVSNTLIGNGWREEMICSVKAQALASGLVSKVIVANRNGGPSEQIADLRNLISAGANAIIVNPSDREALNPVIKQAADRGIVVVAVDRHLHRAVGRRVFDRVVEQVAQHELHGFGIAHHRQRC